MTDFVEGVEQFGEDWWKDMTEGQWYMPMRTCENAPLYFTKDCKLQAPDYWVSSTEERQWTYDLYYHYLDRDASYANESILREISDIGGEDIHEIS